MSLISLSSADKNHNTSQQPFNFKNNFSQPIIIKPNSQVALVNFYHFRNDGIYNINLTNNRIVFNFDDPNSNGRFNAFLQINQYTGDELAIEIARALNEGNIAFQNFTFSCAFTLGNSQANPPTNDVFEITFASVATPTIKGGTYTNLLNDGNVTITNDEDDNESTQFVKVNETPDYAVIQMENGIHNHEGQWFVEDLTMLNGTNDNFLVTSGVNNVYEYSFGSKSFIFGLYAENLCSFTSSNPLYNYNKDRPSISISLKNRSIFIRTIDRRTNRLNTKKSLKLTLNGILMTAFSNLLFTNGNRWGEILYKFVFIKDGVANVGIQIQVSGDGGLTYVIPSEANNQGTVFGVNADGCPNIYETQSISGVNYNGIIYMSKQDGNPLAVGGSLGSASKSNVLAKANGKYRCIVNITNNFKPINIENNLETGNSNWDLTGRTFDVDYGTGGSKFNLTCVPHAGGNAFDFNINTDTQAGTPIAGQLIATDLTNTALKRNLTKNNLGLVWDIHADDADAGSAVIGELHFDRRAVNNSNRGNISIRNLGGTLAGKTEKFNIPVPTSHIEAVAKRSSVFFTQGIYNQNNLKKQKQLGVSAEPHHHGGDFTQYEDLPDIPTTLLGADLSSKLVLLLDRINQNDIDSIAGINTSPLRLTTRTRAGTIGKLIGFSNNVVFMTAKNSSQPIDPTNPFRSNAETLIISKDTTLHIGIPELAGVKSFEGEISQQYKTIKVIPKSDFQQGSNGSLSFTSNYQDFIDINNAQELQLNELTIQVREPDGTMATTLQPVSRATIKIQQNPKMEEINKQEKLLDRMERMMSQNQNKVMDVSNPSKIYT